MARTHNWGWFNKWKSELFAEDEDATWKDWVDFHGGVIKHDLTSLLNSNIKLGFRARALALLLVPDLSLSPVYMKVRDRLTNFAHLGGESIQKDMPLPLVQLASDILCESLDHLTAKGASTEDERRSIRSYQSHLLQVLGILPFEEGEAAFTRYAMNDANAFSGIDEESGYNPFASLLRSNSVDERWKRRADSQMREIVLEELAGKKRPRADHEDALSCYSNHVMMQLFSRNGTYYSKAFFADQIHFLYTLSDNRRGVVGSLGFSLLYERFTEPEHAETRHEIAQLVVLRGSEPLSIYDPETYGVIEKALKEFGAQDQALGAELQRLIDESRVRVAERVASESALRSRKSSLQERMKAK